MASKSTTKKDGNADVMRLSHDASSFLRPIPEDSDDGSSSLFPRFQLPIRQQPVGAADDAHSSTRGALVDGGTASSVENHRPNHTGAVVGGARSASIVTDKATIELPVGQTAYRGLQAGGRADPWWWCHWNNLSPRTKLALCFSFGLSVLVILAIVLVVVFTDTNPNMSTPSPTLSAAPSMIPTMSPSTVQGVDEILFNVSNPQDFVNPSTPQSQARDWLLHDDLYLYDAIEEGNQHVAQRYVCAELIFALNPSLVNTTLLVDKQECFWPGFECGNDELVHVVTKINVTAANLSGRLPSELATLPSLKKIALSNNSITGTIPSEWFGSGVMSSLYYLDLSDNNLTGTLDGRIWTNFPLLSFLYLHDNQFSGTLIEPAAVDSTQTNYTEHVFLQNNNFTGPIPNWFLEHFPELRILAMGRNQLTGTLPQDATTSVWPENLIYYDASSNQLQGHIPESVFFAPALQKLFLDTNRLSGSLPDTVTLPSYLTNSNASQLQKVYLHSNQLTGSFPTSFGSMWHNLEEMTLHENAFVGTISSTLCTDWPLRPNVTADCLPNSTDMSCACCSECF